MKKILLTTCFLLLNTAQASSVPSVEPPPKSLFQRSFDKVSTQLAIIKSAAQQALTKPLSQAALAKSGLPISSSATYQSTPKDIKPATFTQNAQKQLTQLTLTQAATQSDIPQSTAPVQGIPTQGVPNQSAPTQQAAPPQPAAPAQNAAAQTTLSNAQKEAAKKSDISREYYLKAAFLRYVAEFVQWPKDSISDSAVTICVYGEIPSLEGLNSINGKVVNNRSVVIRTIPNVDIAKNEKQACQMLYMGEFKKPSLDSIIEQMKSLPIITFGDKAGLAEKGGSMNFYVANNRMGIMVNQETVAQNKLQISPRMLKLVTLFPKN